MNKFVVFIIILVVIVVGVGLYLSTSSGDSGLPFIGGTSDNLSPPPLPE